MAYEPRAAAKGTGVITFLDVLGWKGVYDRKNDAIAALTTLIEGLQSEAKLQRGRVASDVVIKSISDTIAIFTGCAESEVSKAIESHGELCRWILPRSIDAEIPVRGAIAFGEFETRDSIFVGKAVDEAAAWHEQADWIGVHLTPSAEFIFKPAAEAVEWKGYNPPTKTRLDWKPKCVNWTSSWENAVEEIARLKEKFRRLGPIVPEIAGKFTNTLRFIEELHPHAGVP